MNVADRYKRKRRSLASEKSLALKIQGKVQPLSGALPIAKFKGDVENDFFLVDDKTTQSKSFAVNSELMQKLYLDAFRKKKRAALSIQFEASNTVRRVFVISEREFQEYLHLLRVNADNL